MNARFRKLLGELRDSFWLVPASMVLAGIFMAVGLLELDRRGTLPVWLTTSGWFYNGGGMGARTLLGAIASSTIGVAGTVFSITIAGLSLAAGQMGPRLLRNFTRDRGVQVTLGAFIGTFSYALMVLRSVRTQEEGAFTPHLALSFGVVLAFACVGTLVYFVAHMANRINVDTVVDLVSNDLRRAISAISKEDMQAPPPPLGVWSEGTVVFDARRGYVQQLDETSLAQWAAAHRTVIRLLVRRGDYVFPGAPIAVITARADGVEHAIRDATALGDVMASEGDVEYAIRQLVEVAVRALSTGINDPHTAMSVMDRLGASLCDLADVRLPTGVRVQDDSVALVVPNVTYAGLVDAMFNMIRQNAAGNVAVLSHLLHVLSTVVATERNAERKQALAKHAALVWADARSHIINECDLTSVRACHENFMRAAECGALGAIESCQH